MSEAYNTAQSEGSGGSFAGKKVWVTGHKGMLGSAVVHWREVSGQDQAPPDPEVLPQQARGSQTQ
jgi:hypothetical protein